tara:strand:- start:118 stop:300 length:183 start_codon:yes stop_codon:yes gene_type:complete
MGDCKKCGHNCHCSNGQCECKDCDCKDRSLKKSIKVLSDITKKKAEKTVVFDPDFSLTEH